MFSKIICLCLCLFVLVSCFSQDTRRNQAKELFFVPLTYPQAEWSKDDFGEPPKKEAQKLLKKFLPRVFISKGALLPLDFYKDYLPQTVLKNNKAQVVRQSVTRRYLKAIERNFDFYLDYQGALARCFLPDCANITRKIYGRVFFQVMYPPRKYAQDKPIEFQVLKYNLVFATSGLPKELSWYKNIAIYLLGDRENWHELDIHGAIQLLVDAKTKKPLVLLLAQHNHFRSYVIGQDLVLPEDNRINICIAQRSNEPYPCRSEQTKLRTVGNHTNFDFVLGGRQPLFDGGYDIVFSKTDSVEQNLVLEFLPTRDPLYTSWIALGDKQKILGIIPSFARRGPPGINMNNMFSLREYTDIAKVWYFSKNDPVQRKLFSDMGSVFDSRIEDLLEYNGSRLWEDIKKYKDF